MKHVRMDKTSLYISIICIIATEFWERFSFCGLRTILSLYLRNELRLAENSATVVYHVFIMACYMIPIFGAICADSFLGRYRTILYFSLVYIMGNILMIFAAIPTIEISPILATILGLGCIAIGTGGTKPCVAAFGGDQFYLPVQQDKLQQFFSLFYFSINLGGFVGMILTPILRKAVTCFGDDTCYALGFGFPAILMIFSLLLFVLGKPWYRMKKPKGNIMLQFVNCTTYALTQRMKTAKDENHMQHWLDYSRDKFNRKLIHDMKIVYAVLFLYTPLPLFWSLFDQQGSRWTFQASRMNGFFMGVQIVPDQMQVVNPALVLVLIPFFDKWLYPLLSRNNFMTSHLHRMAIGGLIAGLAFLTAGVLELFLERNYPKMPGENRASVNVINTLPCNLEIFNPFNEILYLNSSEKFMFQNIPAHNVTKYNVTVKAPGLCGDIVLPKNSYGMTIVAVEHRVDTVIIGTNYETKIVDYIIDPIEFKRSLSGKPRIRIVFLFRSTDLLNVTVSFISSGGLNDIYFLTDMRSDGLAVSDYLELPPDGYEYLLRADGLSRPFEGEVHLALGGVYTIVLSERNRDIEFVKIYTMSPPNDVNIMWLIPQYFLISIAEIMFGIAGLEFSFTQAPKSMKTVTIAAWYLSVAVGNFMVILVTQANVFDSQAYEFFLFAVLIVGDMMLFTQMSSHYHYVELEADSSVYMLSTTDSMLADSESDIELPTDGRLEEKTENW